MQLGLRLCVLFLMNILFLGDFKTGNLPGETCWSDVFSAHVRGRTVQRNQPGLGAELPGLDFWEI